MKEDNNHPILFTSRGALLGLAAYIALIAIIIIIIFR